MRTKSPPEGVPSVPVLYMGTLGTPGTLGELSFTPVSPGSLFRVFRVFREHWEHWEHWEHLPRMERMCNPRDFWKYSRRKALSRMALTTIQISRHVIYYHMALSPNNSNHND